MLLANHSNFIPTAAWLLDFIQLFRCVHLMQNSRSRKVAAQAVSTIKVLVALTHTQGLIL